MLTVSDWAQQQWGAIELGDKRRNCRAVQLGTQIAAQPDATLPGQTQSWGDLKGAYRLNSLAGVELFLSPLRGLSVRKTMWVMTSPLGRGGCQEDR